SARNSKRATASVSTRATAEALRRAIAVSASATSAATSPSSRNSRPATGSGTYASYSHPVRSRRENPSNEARHRRFRTLLIGAPCSRLSHNLEQGRIEVKPSWGRHEVVGRLPRSFADKLTLPLRRIARNNGVVRLYRLGWPSRQHSATSWRSHDGNDHRHQTRHR